jgi:hypothetical protein
MIVMALGGCAAMKATPQSSAVQQPQEPEDPQQAWNPAVAIDAKGRIFMSFYRGLGENRFGLYFTRSLDGGLTWSPEPVHLYTLDPHKPFIQFHQIGTDGSGKVWVTWLTERKERNFLKPVELHARFSSDLGTTWDADSIEWKFEGNSNYPQAVRDGRGELHLLWTQDSIRKAVPRFTRTRGGGTALASTPITIPGLEGAQSLRSGLPVREADWPTLAVDPRGAVLAVWQEEFERGIDILFNRSHDGGQTWLGSSLRISTPPSKGGYTSRQPILALDGNQGAYVVWEDGRHNTTDLYFNRSLDGGVTWLDQDVWLTAVRPSIADAYKPTLRSDRSGHLYLLWTDIREARNSFWFTRSLDRGSSWLPNAVRIDRHGPDTTTHAPTLANDDSGHVYAVWWEGTDPTKGTIRFNRSDDYGATWLEMEQTLSNTTGKESPRFPVLTVDEQGVVYVIWSSDRSGNYQLYLNRSTDHGKTWLPEPRKLTGRPVRSPQGS